MNKKKCIMVSILILISLIGLYLSPQNSLANNLDNGVAIIDNLNETESIEYEPIIPKKVLPPITPIKIQTEKENVENGRAETEIEQSGIDYSGGEEFDGVERDSADMSGYEEDTCGLCEFVRSETGGVDESGDEIYECSDDFEAAVEEPAYEEPVEEVVQEESGPFLEYLGDWIITAYCGCAECCGSWGNATASGAYPTSYHTIACNSLPFGTQVMIGDIVYTVEDTGWTPYGDAWIDIYFDSHEEALAYGMHTESVYIVR